MSMSEAGVMLDTTVAVLAVILILITFFIRRKNSPPLPPGPGGYPLVGSLFSLNPELTTCFTQLAKTYGPIYSLKLGRKVGIVISSPELAQEILKRHDATFSYRDMPVVANETSYGGSNISWSPYGPEWRMRRKLASHEILGKNILDSVYALRHREVRLMVKHLHSQAGSPVNVGEIIFLTLLDILTSMLWGGRLSGDARRGVEFREVITKMIELLSKLNISDFYPQLARFDIQGMHKRMKVLVHRFDTLFDDMIEQRLKMDGGGGEGDVNGEGSKDFLHVLLKLKEEQNGNQQVFTLMHVKALLMDIITGGTESTGNTVEFALAEMMNQPHILQKVQQELETVLVAADKNSTILEESAIQNLPYLRALMKETLRLHPPLPFLLPHRSNSANCNVAGYHIPKDSLVFINAWAIHRDPSTWENPLEFRPERFLDDHDHDGKLDFSGNDFRYFPFGSGRRICPGIAMAERMFTYLVATLVHSFDWKLAPGENMDLSEQYGLISRKKIPLLAIPTPRLSGCLDMFDSIRSGTA